MTRKRSPEEIADAILERDARKQKRPLSKVGIISRKRRTSIDYFEVPLSTLLQPSRRRREEQEDE